MPKASFQGAQDALWPSKQLSEGRQRVVLTQRGFICSCRVMSPLSISALETEHAIPAHRLAITPATGRYQIDRQQPCRHDAGNRIPVSQPIQTRPSAGKPTTRIGSQTTRAHRQPNQTRPSTAKPNASCNNASYTKPTTSRSRILST